MNKFIEALPEEGRLVKVTYQHGEDLTVKSKEIIWKDGCESNYDDHLLEWCYV